MVPKKKEYVFDMPGNGYLNSDDERKNANSSSIITKYKKQNALEISLVEVENARLRSNYET